MQIINIVLYSIYIVITLCLLIGLEPTVNFGNQRNLQISQLSASRLATYLQVTHALHDFQEQCQTVFHTMLCLSLFSSKQCIIKQSLNLVFCDICNNEDLGKCYQPQPSAWLIALTLSLIISDITETSSNNNYRVLFISSSGYCI